MRKDKDEEDDDKSGKKNSRVKMVNGGSGDC